MRGGRGTSLADRVGEQATSSKRKHRYRKHGGKSARDADMDECESLDSDMARRFAECFTPFMRAFTVPDLNSTEDDGDDQPEAGPLEEIPEEEDIEIPEGDEPEQGNGGELQLLYPFVGLIVGDLCASPGGRM